MNLKLLQQSHCHMAHVLCAIVPTKGPRTLFSFQNTLHTAPLCHSSAKHHKKQRDLPRKTRESSVLRHEMHAKEWKKRPRQTWNRVGDNDDDKVLEVSPSWKMLRLGSPPVQQHNLGGDVLREQLAQSSIAARSSPLGLRLRKTASFMNKIQIQLAHDARAKQRYTTTDANRGVLDRRSVTKPTPKACQFHASILRIGAWEWRSRNDGDLVAKFYYTNNKVVWEILNKGLKSKMEIYWRDISALRVTCPEGGPETLEIMLSRRPRFFRETSQQPRRSTAWLAATDFTGGQASMHRRHVLQCAPGILNKHIAKLLSSNHRLYSLSMENTIDKENPYFGQQWQPVSEVLESSNVQNFCSYAYHQLRRQQFRETVPTSVGTNAQGGINHNGSQQDGMPVLIPTSAPRAHASVITRTSSGSLELYRDMFNCNNSSFQMPHQTQLNISNGRIMNDTTNYMTNPNKRWNLLTSVGTTSSSLIQPENVRKFVKHIRSNNSQVSSYTSPMYSDGASNWKTRELDVSNFAFNNTTQTFQQTDPRYQPSNDNATMAAMVLEKITNDLLSDTDTEPTDAAEEAMIMSRINSLSNLLQQDPALAIGQSSQASNAPAAAAAAFPFDFEAGASATQVPDVAPFGSSGGSWSNNDLLPSTGMESVLWEQEPVVDMDMDMVYLSKLLPFCP